jgi:4-amino-4-deoxy-L-arabinose transferase-like glycosyltransferase
MKSENSGVYRALLLTTVLIGALVFFWGLGDIPLLSYNEARRAIPAANMIADGDWLLPKLNGELYITKPPLIYWAAAASSYLFGTVNEWAVRLPSALAASATAWLAYRFALRQFGTWSALFTLQILIANAGFSMLGRRAGIEMLLTALCFGALLSALKYTRENGRYEWLLLSYFLLGAAVLAKGPIALLFVTLPLLCDAIYQRQPRQWQALRDPLSWIIFLFVGSSWYLAVTWHMGFDIWQATVQKDMVSKIYSSSGEPFYNYFLWLAADFFPASLLLFIAPVAAWRRWRKNGAIVSLLIALFVPFLIYTAFSDKHAKYLLPIYPVVAILLGLRLGELFSLAGPYLRRCILVATILLLSGYAAFYILAEARVFYYRHEALPLIKDWIANNVDNAPIYGYMSLDERLIYYANRNIPIIDDAMLKSLGAGSALLLVEDSHIEKVQPQAGCLIKTFKPYLKRNESLAVFGFGSACQKQQ